jgi:hypothetical protein
VRFNYAGLENHVIRFFVLRSRLAAVAVSLLVSLGNQAVAQVSGQSRSLVPTLRIGGDKTGDVIRTETPFLEIGRDGRIYVLQPWDQLVRVLDPSGRVFATIGRNGAGPGEFRFPLGLGWHGDSLWVYDPSLSRISLFTADGKFVRSFVLGTMGAAYLLADGSIAIKREEAAVPRRNGNGRTAPLLRFSANWDILDTIADPDVITLAPLRIPAGGGRLRIGQQPFDDNALWAVASNGTHAVIVDRRAALRAGNAEFRVTKLGLSGDTVFSKRYPYTARSVTAGLLDYIVAETVGRFRAGPAAGDAGLAADRDAIRNAIHRPPTVPPVSALVVARDGSIWLRREELETPTVQWLVLDERGGIVATVVAPKKVKIRNADRGSVWAIETDSDGVPFVVRYQLR